MWAGMVLVRRQASSAGLCWEWDHACYYQFDTERQALSKLSLRKREVLHEICSKHCYGDASGHFD